MNRTLRISYHYASGLMDLWRNRELLKIDDAYYMIVSGCLDACTMIIEFTLEEIKK